MTSNNYLSEKVREARGKLSFRQFSVKCRLSHAYIQRIECGVNSRDKPLCITIHTLAKLIRCGVKIDLDYMMSIAIAEIGDNEDI